ncbi:MAG: SPFH domain-containing protein [Spirochaetaceae bacterium]|jgi:regulator of protease activity HflC (stomatin/prohibitin superfamily)|nr:SPFH domain-containing protein [Spirochaetaceae bacterium]
MNTIQNNDEKSIVERTISGTSGMPILLVNTILMLAVGGLLIFKLRHSTSALSSVMIGACIFYLSFIGPVVYCGLKVLRPREAVVLVLFGKYYGTLRGPGFFWVNPFAQAFNPASTNTTSGSIGENAETAGSAEGRKQRKTLSLKVMTLNNNKQKINDQLGNPIIIGIAVFWKVVNTAQAVFNVDNYLEFLSIQCDSALRNIVRLYPYDSAGMDDAADEQSLRGSSDEISRKLAAEIQSKVALAGLEILEARITHLSYAPEIAAAMLQRQQAAAVIDARKMIVEGAVSMVEMALHKLNDKNIIHLDEERKAAMISNLLVVLCSHKDTQPVVNSGSLY